MYWKDELARKFLCENQVTHKELLDLQREYPQVRVKTLDAAGKIPVIQLQGKSEWMKPREWAVDHLRSLRAQLLDVQARVATIRGDNVCDMVDDCSLVKELKEQHSEDLTKLDRALQEAAQAEEALNRITKERDLAVGSYRVAVRVAEEVRDQSDNWQEHLDLVVQAIANNKYVSSK